jgi:hypothetical protein
MKESRGGGVVFIYPYHITVYQRGKGVGMG